MTQEYKKAYYDALTTAAEMIRGHVEGGLSEEDINGMDIDIYTKACQKVFRMLSRKAEKLLPELNN